jgi:hypothetical protein
MCTEFPVIPVIKVVDPKRIIRINAEEEERHKGSLTQKKLKKLKGNSARYTSIMSEKNGTAVLRTVYFLISECKTPHTVEP